MIRLLVDQNFNEHILDGLRRRGPTVDLIHVRDVGLSAGIAPDAFYPFLLTFAAHQLATF